MNQQQQQQRAGKSNMLAWAGEVGKWDYNDLKLPEGFELYKLEAGTHQIDLMPYVVSDLSATFRHQRADPGFEHPERQYHTHRLRLPNGKTSQYVCLWETYGEQCPVCKWMNGPGVTQDKEYADSLFPTQRHLWVVNDKPGDLKNPFKIMTTNFKNRGAGFGQQVATAIQAEVAKGNQNAPYFYDLESGYTLQYVGVEMSFPGGKYIGISRIDFLPRRYKYPKEVLKRVPNLDAIPVRLTYQELNAALLGESATAPHPELVANGDGGSFGSHTGQREHFTQDNAKPADEFGDWPNQPEAEYVPLQGDLVNYEYGGKQFEKVKVVAVNLAKKLVKTEAGTVVDWVSLTPWKEPEPEPVAEDDWNNTPAAEDSWDTTPAEESAAEAQDTDDWTDASADSWADDPAPVPAKQPAAKGGGKVPAKKPAPPPADNGWDDEPVPQQKPAAKGGKAVSGKKK